MTARKDPHSKCGSRTWHEPRARKRTPPPPPLPPNARPATAEEQAEMQRLLDRMLQDEQTLRLNGHNPTSPPLYRADVVAVMDATIAGRLIDANAMFDAMDLLDAHHALAQAADKGTHQFHQARQALMSIAQGDWHDRQPSRTRQSLEGPDAGRAVPVRRELAGDPRP